MSKAKSKKLECVCHYPGKSNYSNEIKTLSQNNIDRLVQAKQKREELGGAHLHLQQVQQIPQTFDLEKHGVHSRPCYNL